MLGDPPIRKDGKCGCGKTLGPISIKNEDPFCSTECCKKHYGVGFSVAEDEVVADELAEAA